MLVSIMLYFKWPWLAVTVSWIELARAVHASQPWEIGSTSGVVFQLWMNLLFVSVAHVGLISQVLLKRHKAEASERTHVSRIR